MTKSYWWFIVGISSVMCLMTFIIVIVCYGHYCWLMCVVMCALSFQRAMDEVDPEEQFLRDARNGNLQGIQRLLMSKIKEEAKIDINCKGLAVFLITLKCCQFPGCSLDFFFLSIHMKNVWSGGMLKLVDDILRFLFWHDVCQYIELGFEQTTYVPFLLRGNEANNCI